MTRRIEKLPCDGVPRYRVEGKSNLTYNEAWERICLLNPAADKEGKMVSPGGFRMLKRLNRRHEHLLRAFSKKLREGRNE